MSPRRHPVAKCRLFSKFSEIHHPEFRKFLESDSDSCQTGVNPCPPNPYPYYRAGKIT